MQYPGNKGLSIAEGKIIEFKNDNTNIIHSVSTDSGSSGSPIILSTRNLNIIGIHQGQSKSYNRGVYFRIVLEDIEKQYSNFIQKPIGTYEYKGKNYDKYSLKQFEENNRKW